MLVLTRKKNECIRIGDNIVVTIVEVRGDKVRIGIEAPKEVPVDRQEVFEAKLAGKTAVKKPKPEKPKVDKPSPTVSSLRGPKISGYQPKPEDI